MANAEGGGTEDTQEKTAQNGVLTTRLEGKQNSSIGLLSDSGPWHSPCALGTGPAPGAGVLLGCAGAGGPSPLQRGGPLVSPPPCLPLGVTLNSQAVLPVSLAHHSVCPGFPLALGLLPQTVGPQGKSRNCQVWVSASLLSGSDFAQVSAPHREVTRAAGLFQGSMGKGPQGGHTRASKGELGFTW